MIRFSKFIISLLLIFAISSFAFPLPEKHCYVAEGSSLPAAPITDRLLSYELLGAKENKKTAISELRRYIFQNPGEYTLSSRLFGVIPLTDTAVSVYREREVIVGGQSVGLILNTDGVVVVGFSAVESDRGETIYPAKTAGIHLGDCIVAIDGNEVRSDDEVLKYINSCGADGNVELTLHSAGKTFKKTVSSYFCEETGRYRIGLYVRDNTGGIGTLTFYDPLTKRFGALGHGVAEARENQQGISGRLISAAISGINPASVGKTGEKIGYFENFGLEAEIDRIGSFGVFGTMTKPPTAGPYGPLQTASPAEIEKGPAKIVTVIDKNRQETFDVEITAVDSSDASGKGISLTVTDQKLLQKTGGIIQGMSGSPILQNGKLVGAVTYVMVNQPQKGYGCFIHDMLKECGIE